MHCVLTLWLSPLDLFVEQVGVQRCTLVTVKIADVMCWMGSLCDAAMRRLINTLYIR